VGPALFSSNAAAQWGASSLLPLRPRTLRSEEPSDSTLARASEPELPVHDTAGARTASGPSREARADGRVSDVYPGLLDARLLDAGLLDAGLRGGGERQPMMAHNDTVPLDFDAVVAEHGPYIWRVLRRLGVRPSDIEDVWQETFIVVHRKLDAFEGRSQLRTWLSAIAVRVASDYRNRAHRRREQATEEVPDDGTAASQHDDLVEQERRALLDRLIGELKPEQREVIVLYEFAELPMQEVAEALGCPLQTAYSRLHAARRALEQAARREQARRGLP
jgi:RNA polymerase sigma-70 factor (ECF subfamily)